jgi:hypothetical protein
MEIVEWLNVGSRPYHLTIQNILNLSNGDSIEIFFMDRNVMDISCDKEYNEENIPIKPSHFFRNCNYITFTKKEGIIGDWDWHCTLLTKKLTYKEREFDIDLGDFWYPLKNNKVPESNEYDLFDLSKYSGKHYSEFSPDTRIGWRGEMMLKENMDKCPNVYWN